MIGKYVPAGYSPESSPYVLQWWPLVKTDNLLFHVMLLGSAFDLEWHNQRPNSFRSVAYTKECMRLLRARVEDQACGVNNQTIGAVATLASLAVSD